MNKNYIIERRINLKSKYHFMSGTMYSTGNTLRSGISSGGLITDSFVQDMANMFKATSQDDDFLDMTMFSVNILYAKRFNNRNDAENEVSEYKRYDKNITDKIMELMEEDVTLPLDGIDNKLPEEYMYKIKSMDDILMNIGMTTFYMNLN